MQVMAKWTSVLYTQFVKKICVSLIHNGNEQKKVTNELALGARSAPSKEHFFRRKYSSLPWPFLLLDALAQTDTLHILPLAKN